GIECALHRGIDHPRSRLRAAHDLLPVVDALRKDRPGKSVGCGGLGGDGRNSAADSQFRGNPGSDLGSLQLRRDSRSARRPRLSDHPVTLEHADNPALRHHFSTAAQQKNASSLGMWLFLATEIMFFGGMFLAYLIYRNAYFNE